MEAVAEVMQRLADLEAEVQALVEAHMEAMLGVRFRAGEYSTGPAHGVRIDPLGIDGDGVPLIIEYKRGTEPGVINQGLYFMTSTRRASTAGRSTTCATRSTERA
ncbi:hypothetical protein ACFWSF_31835 [Streptomyces sp. NPDC058611]|uniref:hypothetical protein n=1 Tax=unclassified Streptomyces TaxID=2593676 RepID=UPI0036673109